MIEPCGHLSLFLGRSVLNGAWRSIARWLLQGLSKTQGRMLLGGEQEHPEVQRMTLGGEHPH
jgi:hypothetical protein